MKNATGAIVLFSIMLGASLAAADPSLLVVEVHESKDGGNLWYHVGVADPLARTVDWGESHKYDKGHLPMVAVDGLNVVEVHQSLEKKDVLASMTAGEDVAEAPRLFYHVGTVNIGTKSISWGESHKYDSGRWPSVALQGQLVTEVHQARGGEFLWYHVGILDPATKTIEWGPSTQYDRGWFSAVDVHGRYVVEAHRSLSKTDSRTDQMKPTRLFCHVGILNGDTRSIGWSESQKYDEKGKFPNITVSGQTVVEVHQSHKENALWYHVGDIDAQQRRIVWGKSQKYDLGRMPTADLAGQAIVEVHQSRKNSTLWYHVGTVDAGTRTIAWGESHSYDKGYFPNLSITPISR